jgi:hypothetical protein
MSYTNKKLKNIVQVVNLLVVYLFVINYSFAQSASYESTEPANPVRKVSPPVNLNEFSEEAIECARSIGADFSKSPKFLNCFDPQYAEPLYTTADGGQPFTFENLQKITNQKCDYAHGATGICRSYAYYQNLYDDGKRTLFNNPDVAGAMICRQGELNKRLYFQSTDAKYVPYSKQERVNYYLGLKEFPEYQTSIVGRKPGLSIQNYMMVYGIESVAMILTNKKTGRTCFFELMDFESLRPANAMRWINGAVVPFMRKTYTTTVKDLPNENTSKLPVPTHNLYPEKFQEEMYGKDWWKNWWKNESRDLYFRTGEHNFCSNCHAIDPFIHSKWIMQGDKPHRVPHKILDKDVPYRLSLYSDNVVNNKLSDMNAPGLLRQVDTKPIKRPNGETTNNKCTSCHNMAADTTLKFEVDLEGSKNANLEGGSIAGLLYWIGATSSWDVTSEANTIPFSERMPLSHGFTSENDWYQEYRQDILSMACCIINPRAIGCKFRDVVPSAIQEYIDPVTKRPAARWKNNTWQDGKVTSRFNTCCLPDKIISKIKVSPEIKKFNEIALEEVSQAINGVPASECNSSTPTPTPSNTPVRTATPTATPSPTATFTHTPNASPTPTPTARVSATPSPSPTATSIIDGKYEYKTFMIKATKSRNAPMAEPGTGCNQLPGCNTPESSEFGRVQCSPVRCSQMASHPVTQFEFETRFIPSMPQVQRDTLCHQLFGDPSETRLDYRWQNYNPRFPSGQPYDGICAEYQTGARACDVNNLTAYTVLKFHCRKKLDY